MEQKMLQLEKKLRQQQYLFILLSTLIALSFLFSFTNKEKPEVIRVKGIVVLDDAGKERILIGSPIPYSVNRVRTDSNRVKEIWAKDFPKQYMNWYKGYNHSADGIVFLDEQGFDRLAIGSAVPDPNIGKRIGPATGLVINDQKGFERSGYSLLKMGNYNRMVLGLDRPGGTEGVTLSILEDGTAGLGVFNLSKGLFAGNAPSGSFVTGLDKNFLGLIVRDSTSIKHNLGVEE